MTIEADVRSILSSDFGLDTGALAGDAALFSSGVLDSLSSLRLLMSLEQKFGLSISPLDVSLDDVDTIDLIAATVERLQA